MTDRWTPQLSEYLDGDLAAEPRAELETHLAGCSECRRTLEELRSVVAQATRLEPLAPPRDLWPGVAARIGAAPARRPTRAAWRERLWTFTLPQLAAAGFLLALLSGGAMWLMLSRHIIGSAAPGSGSVALAPTTLPATTTALTVPASFSTTQYDAAIAELEGVLRQHRAELDTSTVRIIEQNLAVIDQATDQARRALAADPANPYLNGHLAEQMLRKVDLLRQATALVSAHG